ncbi:MAG: fatty acid desaturase family protein [Deltaproteobacteria bacterium]|jgi:stearoyl-CoA desaturase (delta-9 desaturase)
MSAPAEATDSTAPARSRAAPGFWTSLPYAQFKRDRYFYVKYDTAVGLLCGGVIAALVASGYTPPAWQPWMHVLLVPALYVMIVAHAFAHNASHGNFPKPINRLVGELVGLMVISKFASWEIPHRRHHRYSDDPVRDPHPAHRRFWRYAYDTLVNVEKQLQQQYLDDHGDTPENRRYEKMRSAWSFFTGLVVAAMWFTLFGPGLFAFVYLPAFLLSGLFVIHFNWSGHNAHTADGKIEPVNLDHGWFWIGNRIFFGIYYHGNHHRMARVFNPMKMPLRAAEAAAADD